MHRSKPARDHPQVAENDGSADCSRNGAHRDISHEARPEDFAVTNLIVPKRLGVNADDYAADDEGGQEGEPERDEVASRISHLISRFNLLRSCVN
jgi:hypothetical protein